VSELSPEKTLFLVREGRDGIEYSRDVRNTAGILPCGKSRDYPGIHWCCGSVSSALRVPAEADSIRNESGYGRSHRNVREESLGEESVLGPIRCDGRAGADTGSGPGDSLAGSRDYNGDCDMKNANCEIRISQIFFLKKHSINGVFCMNRA
jgi:hypothetical protein